MAEGLTTPDQREAANKYVEERISHALAGIRKPPQRSDFASVADYNNALKELNDNIFHKKVQDIYDTAKLSPVRNPSTGQYEINEDQLARDINDLKISSKNAMAAGVKNPGVMDIISGAFNDFDITKPIDSITKIISGIFQGIVKLFGGEYAAPYLNAAKSNFDKDKNLVMNVAQADRHRHFDNSARALAGVLGVPVTDQFSTAVANDLHRQAEGKRAVARPEASPLVAGKIYDNKSPGLINDELAGFMRDDIDKELAKALNGAPAKSVVLVPDTSVPADPKKFSAVVVGHREGGQFVVDAMFKTAIAGQDAVTKKPIIKLARVETRLEKARFAINGDAITTPDVQQLTTDSAVLRVGGNIVPVNIAMDYEAGKPPKEAQQFIKDSDLDKAIKDIKTTKPEEPDPAKSQVMFAVDPKGEKLIAYVGHKDGDKFVVDKKLAIGPGGKFIETVPLATDAGLKFILGKDNKVTDAYIQKDVADTRPKAVITDDFKKAVEEYAKVRFGNAKTKDGTRNKADVFTEDYLRAVQSAKIPVNQQERAAYIKGKTAGLKPKLTAIEEAFKLADPYKMAKVKETIAAARAAIQLNDAEMKSTVVSDQSTVEDIQSLMLTLPVIDTKISETPGSTPEGLVAEFNKAR